MDICLSSLHLNLIVHLHEFVYYIHFYILLNEYVLSLQVVQNHQNEHVYRVILATFAFILGEEEDSPMIRGFSDDEPLVIA